MMLFLCDACLVLILSETVYSGTPHVVLVDIMMFQQWYALRYYITIAIDISYCIITKI